MWICGSVLAVVTASILFIVIRYRQRDDEEPKQTTGNVKLEIIWTAIPILLVAVLFVLSIRTARAVDHSVTREPDIVVTGHQWWWEVAYPAMNAITANVIHVPVGRGMLIAIESADVIHDFWVPRLGRETARRKATLKEERTSNVRRFGRSIHAVSRSLPRSKIPCVEKSASSRDSRRKKC